MPWRALADTGRLREYDETFGERAKQRYFERIYDLAYEIRDVLQVIGDAGGDAELSGRTVYLAEVTSDLSPERDILKRELLERGHRVVPELPLRPLEVFVLEGERERTSRTLAARTESLSIELDAD